jgi:S-adenosyl methyltransferase
MDRPPWVSDNIDLTRPSLARVYDHFLGGSHNLEVDRQMAATLQAIAPDVASVMRANRAFLRRAVRFMLDEGIDQFLDIGSGIPAVGNVHQIAQQSVPSARVVYVDIDPVAVAHSRAMLEGMEDTTAVVQADLCQPEAILGAPDVARLIDVSAPVGLLCVAVLHFVNDEGDPTTALRLLRDAIPSGSFLAISHGVAGIRPDTDEVSRLYVRASSKFTPRTPERILAFFGEFTLVPPGLVFLPVWRPDSPDDVDDHPERFVALAGVGRKP